MDKLKVYILQLWHNAPYMLDKKHIVASDFTPVIFGKQNIGQGDFHVAGYIASIKPEYAAIVIDHSFNITDGNPPAEEDYILCDKIKETITNVISKTISSLQIELKVAKMNMDLAYLVENMAEEPEMPPQLFDILRWELKKLMTDYAAEYNPEQYNPDFYFSKTPEMSAISDVLSTWDMFFNLSRPVLDKVIDGLNLVTIDPDTIILLDDLNHSVAEHIDSVKRISDIINAKCPKSIATEVEED